jgi:hypothetical protein
MSNKAHNKKRNAGLLYEFLVRSISRALVEGDQKKSAIALKLLKKHFKPGTELHKEFRLINALIKTTVSSEAVASSILGEAKAAARDYNLDALDREKSLLIKNINHMLSDGNFYDQQINEYRMYATVQTLLNDWRSKERNISRMASYEDQLVRWLVSEKQPLEEQHLSDETQGTSRLLMKVMTKKLNEKYAAVLNEEQKSLVRAYVFSTANSDPTVIKKKLQEIRESVLQQISEYEAANKDNQYINNKLQEVRGRLASENVESFDDNMITRFMLYTRLNAELNGEE